MAKDRSFIITIDTEADNQWDVNHPITTENARYLPRFQELCEKYGFKPVWLTNYEMANDDFFVSYMKPKQDKGLCEIGMHLHAWYTPPQYSLEKINDNREYLIEYPYDIMEEKISTMTEILTEKFGKTPVSHRAGRWAMDDRYFKLLSKYGYKVDCSVTPGMDWSRHLGATGVGGSNYIDYPITPYFHESGILEVPLTIRMLHMFDIKRINTPRSLLSEVKKLMIGRIQWLRQDNAISENGNLYLVDKMNKENTDYMMFMIHSSELMPGGNPTFRDNYDIELLYDMLNHLFIRISSIGFKGKTLAEYVKDFNC